MKHIIRFLIISLTIIFLQPAHGANWLDKKRQNTLDQRRAAEAIKLEEKRLQQEEMKRQQEKHERELEKRERELEQRERERKREEAREQELTERRKSAAAEAAIRTKLKNMRNSLKNFDAAPGVMWVTHRPGLLAFSELQECEEYVSYRRSRAAYAMRYARDLIGESVVEVNTKGHLKVQENNCEEILPQEYALRDMCKDGEDVSAYESAESAAQHLKEQADKKGIVRVLTFRGDEYWVAYHDLTEYAAPDMQKAKNEAPKENK